jgi:hypothetical protein
VESQQSGVVSASALTSKEARQAARKASPLYRRYGVAAGCRFDLGGEAMRVFASGEVGLGWFDAEISVSTTGEDSDPHYIGAAVGIGYALFGEKWLLTAGGGVELLLISKEYEVSSFDSTSTETMQEFLTMPFIQTRFSRTLMGGRAGEAGHLILFAGYRMSFFPAEKYNLYYDGSATGDVQMTHSIFLGLGLNWDSGRVTSKR